VGIFDICLSFGKVSFLTFEFPVKLLPSPSDFLSSGFVPSPKGNRLKSEVLSSLCFSSPEFVG